MNGFAGIITDEASKKPATQKAASPTKKNQASKKANPWDTDSDDEADISEVKPSDKSSQKLSGKFVLPMEVSIYNGSFVSPSN